MRRAAQTVRRANTGDFEKPMRLAQQRQPLRMRHEREGGRLLRFDEVEERARCQQPIERVDVELRAIRWLEEELVALILPDLEAARKVRAFLPQAAEIDQR
jgi:hypothetical protein